MTVIITREIGATALGAPLSNAQLDQNFINLNSNDQTILNDISLYFDGERTVFNLLDNQDSIDTVVDSKDVEVTIDGIKLLPYLNTVTYPWIVEYDSSKGYRVKGNKLIIYNAPAAGSYASVILNKISLTKQVKKYPYSATTIALGD